MPQKPKRFQPPSYQAYDQRRGSSKERGYDSQWEKVAKLRRELDCYLCQPCKSQGFIRSANIVDHIIPVHVRPNWRLEIDNTQVICPTCHRVKTDQDNRKYGSSTERLVSDAKAVNRAQAQRLAVPPRNHETRV